MEEAEPEIRIQEQGEWIVITQNDMRVVVKTRKQAVEIVRALDNMFGDATCIDCGNYP